MDQKHNLHITLNKIKFNLPYKPPNELRQLVNVTSNPANGNEEALTYFENKFPEQITIFSNCNLSPYEVIKGYNAFWQLSIKFIALVLILPSESNML